MTTLAARAPVRAQLLGTLAVFRDGVELPLPASANARRLLAYLLLRQKPQARTIVAGRLWPDVPEVAARRSLRQALWQINRCLPGLLVSADPEHLALAADLDLQLDNLEFENLARPHLPGAGYWSETARDLQPAADLYQGDLLEDFDEDWILAERERLRELYLQVLEMLAAALKATLRYERALGTVLQLISADPLRESAYQEAMRLYHYLGNPAAALKQFQLCQDVLEREFGLAPSPETRALAQAIALQAVPSSGAHLPAPQLASHSGLPGRQTLAALPLVGRAAERMRLLQWLQLDEPEPSHLVLVEGEAGVGKTRLLQEVAQDAQWHGATVVWGKASQFEGGRPLGPLLDALEAGLSPLRVEQLQSLVEPLWLQVLEPLLPQLAAGLPSPVSLPALEAALARARLVEALGRLLAGWAQIVPLMVVIEDVQWAAPDALDTLARLPAHLGAAAVVVIMSYRAEEVDGRPAFRQALQALPPESVRGQLKLEGLDQAATRALIQASLGGPATASFETLLYEETRGNPLFVLETLRELFDEGVLRQNPDGSWSSPYDALPGEADLPLPPAVEDVILRRLEQLAPDLRAFLETLAAMGAQFEFKQLAGLGEAPALIRALQDLLKRQLLAETRQAYHFRHDKIRQVVYENLPAERRRALHQQIALDLEKAEPEAVEELGRHFEAAQSWDKAATYLRRAAEKARAALAYAGALQHLGRACHAAELAGRPAAERFDWRCAHEALADLLGERRLQAQDLDDLEKLASQLSGQCAWLTVLLRRARLEYELGDYERMEGTARQALALAGQIGAPQQQAEALNCLADAFHGRFADDQAIPLYEQVIALCGVSGLKEPACQTHRQLAISYSDTMQLSSARGHAAAALTLAEDTGNLSLQAFALGLLAWIDSVEFAF